MWATKCLEQGRDAQQAVRDQVIAKEPTPPTLQSERYPTKFVLTVLPSSVPWCGLAPLAHSELAVTSTSPTFCRRFGWYEEVRRDQGPQARYAAGQCQARGAGIIR